ncbi:MAG: HAMP domain-containing protein [Limnohabitans sp.]|jgi:nitrogen fixation/metabolism regulation signal transduction histidine kinase|nr:HAMP domain-containing protein [Limnohabitans sp.]
MTSDAALARTRRLRWLLGVGLFTMMGLGMVLLFLLTQATQNWNLYERYYTVLFSLNAVVATVLLAVIVWIVLRLAVRLRAGRFGSQLLLKLAFIFALVGFLPGLLIYGVSYQFVSRSIEAWFDTKVEGALAAGLNLGRTSLETLASDLGQKTRQAAVQLVDAQGVSSGLALERLREQLGVDDVVLWSSSGAPLASAGSALLQTLQERPSGPQLRQLRNQTVMTQIEGLEDDFGAGTARPRVKVLVSISAPGLGLLAEPRVLQVTQTLPAALVADSLALQEANLQYQERALARDGLRRMYIGTLTLSLFLSVFGAVLLAVLLGNQLARPLLLLLNGVREVAAGDLGPKPVLSGRNELDGLTRAFAAMTQQLADARSTVERSMEQVTLARTNLQTILDNLTTGVVVLDTQGHIVSSNPGATRILRAPLAAFEGRALAELEGLADFAHQVQAQFDLLAAERQQHGLDHWQHTFELQKASGAYYTSSLERASDGTILVARGAVLPNQARLLVFDDISEIVSAQRAQAWGEVARRLAHEIKNPLTPIQLSAERLEMKLDGKLADPEQAILTKSVKTIVDQVDAMKRLVNEFRDYARLPQAQLEPIDLNALMQDLLQLYSAENATVPVVAQLDPQCPPILGDAQQLRQVAHNLLQNAQDACEGLPVQRVEVSTTWNPQSRRVRLVVRDSGTGFPEAILKRAFEPYVTTKSRGTGLGLAVVKKIADDHGARIDLKNIERDGQVMGAQVSLSFQTADT